MAIPTLDPGDILLVTLKGRLFGQRTNNTFAYYVSIAVAQVITDFFSQWETDFETIWSNAVSEDWTGDTVTIRRVGVNPTRGIDFSIDWTGQVASPSLPPSTAAVISRFNYGAGPKARGRLFVAGVATTHHLEGQLTNPGLALFGLLAAQVDDHVIDGTALDAEPGLFNKETSTFNAIEVATARAILRQQRRREIGVGE